MVLVRYNPRSKVSLLLSWTGTSFQLVFRTWEWYFYAALYTVVLCVSRFVDDASDVLQPVNSNTLSNLSTFVSLFLAFSNAQTFERWFNQIMSTGIAVGRTMVASALVTSALRTDLAKAESVVRYLNAILHITWFGMSIQGVPWAALEERQLLTVVECSILQRHERNAPLIVLSWIYDVINEAVTEGKMTEAMALRLETACQDARNNAAGAAVFKDVQIPKAYVHCTLFISQVFLVVTVYQNALEVGSLLLDQANGAEESNAGVHVSSLGAAYIVMQTLLTGVYVFAVLAFRELFLRLSDPFGADILDYDLDQSLIDCLHAGEDVLRARVLDKDERTHDVVGFGPIKEWMEVDESGKEVTLEGQTVIGPDGTWVDVSRAAAEDSDDEIVENEPPRPRIIFRHKRPSAWSHVLRALKARQPARRVREAPSEAPVPAAVSAAPQASQVEAHLPRRPAPAVPMGRSTTYPIAAGNHRKIGIRSRNLDFSDYHRGMPRANEIAASITLQNAWRSFKERRQMREMPSPPAPKR